MNEKNAKRTESILQHLELAVILMQEARQTDGDVDSRGVSIAITHAETAQLWFENSIKVVEDEEESASE